MKPTYTLNENQRDVLITELTNRVKYEDGMFKEWIQIDDDLEIYCEGFVETDGYTEDDYLNGTGGYIETMRIATIQMKGYVQGHEYWIDDTTEDMADKLLNAA